MDNEQYAYVLGALARIDRKVDFLLEMSQEKKPLRAVDEFEEEFDM
ncbi:MAG: hypothetical protein AAB610_03425 [Patescibacteria group bacterium]